MRNYRGVIKDINHIEKIIFVDDTNNLSSIMNIHGKLIVYVIYSRNPTRLSIYNENENSKEIKDINYTQLYEFNIGIINTEKIYGPIFIFIKHLTRSRGFIERILNIKLNL
jgi:hypothetical protein